MSFCINREFKCDLVIFKASAAKNNELIYNGFEFTKNMGPEVEKHIEEILQLESYEKERKISISKGGKYPFKYYYPYLGHDSSVEHFSVLLGEKEINDEFVYLNILLDLADKAIRYEALE